MRYRLLPFITIIMVFLINVAVYADEEDDHNLTIDGVLTEIRTAQDVKSNSEINPDKVNDELLEKLGEAVMNVQHPDPREHEFMDNMMGGEDSESLKSMHKWMGYNYIRSGFDIRSSYRGRGMMGPWEGMMRGGAGPYGNWTGHMGYGFYWGFWVLIILIAGGVISTIIVLVRKKSLKNGNGIHAIEILKRRLAKGEISKEEFDRLKQDVI